MSDALRLVPLGGLGEVGMNCLAIELGGDLAVVDCGIGFPDRKVGVDVIHADLRYLTERKSRVRALVVTHGHEDHIGAVPYILRALPGLPIYGPPYALALIRERLREHPSLAPASLAPTRPRGHLKIGPFDFEPLRVTHSIADATCLVIRTKAATVVHSGDFKVDETPTDHESFDKEGLAAAGEEGVDLLLSDSTNSLVAGHTRSEQSVSDALHALVARGTARVVVAVFASNVHRLRALFGAARENGRKILLLGRSVMTHVRVASELGYLREVDSIVVGPDEARLLPRDRLLVIAGGTQGEPGAALSRLANQTHPTFELDAGDEVILSSRVIPGNEQPVFALINRLERRDIHVRFWATNPDVHASGHGHREEQRTMLALTKPRAFMPVHGTLVQLRAHAELARSMGLTEILVTENGGIVEVDKGGARMAGHTPTGRVHIEEGQPVGVDVLDEREDLQRGYATVVVPVDKRGVIVADLKVAVHGVLEKEIAPRVLLDAARYVEDELARHKSPRIDLDEEGLRDRAARALKRYFVNKVGRRPVATAIVLLS